MAINYTFPKFNNALSRNEVSITKTKLSDSIIKITLSGLKIENLSNSITKYNILFKLINKSKRDIDEVISYNYQKIVNKRNKNKSVHDKSIEHETNTITSNSDINVLLNISEFSSEEFFLEDNLVYLNIYLLDEEKSIISFKRNIEINILSLENEDNYFESIIDRNGKSIRKDLNSILGSISLFDFENRLSSLMSIKNPSTHSTSDLDFNYEYSSMWQLYNDFDLNLYIGTESQHDTRDFMIKISLNNLFRLYSADRESITYQKITSDFNIENITKIANLSILNRYVNDIILYANSTQDVEKLLDGRRIFSAYMTYKNFSGQENILNSKKIEVKNINVYRFLFNLLKFTGFNEHTLFNNINITGRQSETINVINGNINLENKDNLIHPSFKSIFFDKQTYYRFMVKSNELSKHNVFFNKEFPKLSLAKNIQDVGDRDITLKIFKILNNNMSLLYTNDIDDINTSQYQYNTEDLNYDLMDYILNSALNDRFENNMLLLIRNKNYTSSITSLRMKISYKDIVRNVSINANINYDNSYQEVNNSRYSFVVNASNIIERHSSILLRRVNQETKSIFFNLSLNSDNRLNESIFRFNKNKFDYDSDVTKDFISNFIVCLDYIILNRSQNTSSRFKKIVFLKDYIDNSPENWRDYSRFNIDLLNSGESEISIFSSNSNNDINSITSFINSSSDNDLGFEIRLNYNLCILNKHSYDMLYNSNIGLNDSSYFKIKNQIITLAREKDNSLSESNLSNLIESVYINNNVNRNIFMFDMFEKISSRRTIRQSI